MAFMLHTPHRCRTCSAEQSSTQAAPTWYLSLGHLHGLAFISQSRKFSREHLLCLAVQVSCFLVRESCNSSSNQNNGPTQHTACVMDSCLMLCTQGAQQVKECLITHTICLLYRAVNAINSTRDTTLLSLSAFPIGIAMAQHLLVQNSGTNQPGFALGYIQSEWWYRGSHQTAGVCPFWGGAIEKSE